MAAIHTGGPPGWTGRGRTRTRARWWHSPVEVELVLGPGP
jgi:hypothetical protein